MTAPAINVGQTAQAAKPRPPGKPNARSYTASTYPVWFVFPALLLFIIFFLVPTVSSF